MMTNENIEAAAKSFYGNGRKANNGYLTPLERKALREKLAQHENLNCQYVFFILCEQYVVYISNMLILWI